MGRTQNNHDHPPLFLGLQGGKNYGWGVCSEYLVKELSKLIPVRVVTEEDDLAGSFEVPGVLFQALRNVNLVPLLEKVRGQTNFGYTFFENELTDLSVENARQYKLVLAGSSWCRDRLVERGITNCDVLIQGVDPLKFYPVQKEKSSERFIIFSGGKFELRKGQDIILRALKILQDKYDDIILVNCWYNLWPHTIQAMASSPHIKLPNAVTSPWTQFMHAVYEKNGLRAERIETYELLPNYMLRGVIGCTDIGVFPNRCEGGTNLVMMEYMACAKPVIASNTSGHRDIVNAENALLLDELKNICIYDRSDKMIARWQEPSLDQLVDKIEYAYHNRDAIRRLGQKASQDMKQFTWKHAAMNLLRAIGKVTSSKFTVHRP